ncbi:MAG: hypothetical protein AB1894_04340 [Chloroflexota bacterium]
MSESLNCPICGQSDQVEKVSTIYILGIGVGRASKGTASLAEQAEPSPYRLELEHLPPAELRALSRRLAPPDSGKQAVIRPIQPDLVALTLGLIAPVFLYGILTTQPYLFIPVLVVLALFYALYFWKRRGLLGRFQQQQDSQRAEQERVRTGIERWLKLYYCARDDGVFEPGNPAFTPSDQMAGVLLTRG